MKFSTFSTFSIRSYPDELPVQQKIQLFLLYFIVIVSLVTVPVSIVYKLKANFQVAVIFQSIYLLFLFFGVLVFIITRNIKYFRRVAATGLTILEIFLIIDAGSDNEIVYLFILSGFSLLYFIMGRRASIILPILFFAGIIVRVTFFPIADTSKIHDPAILRELVMVTGIASTTGVIAAILQHTLVCHLRQLAYYDSITGFANRNRMAECLNQSVNDGRSFVLLGMKLNHFEELTKHCDIATGDAILRIVSQRISANTPEHITKSRWAGVIFMVLLYEQDFHPALVMGKKLLSVLKKPVDSNNMQFMLHPVIAMTRYPNDGQTVDKLISNLSLTFAQQETGKENLRVFNEEDGKADKRKFTIATALKGAQKNNEFSLVYQPKVRFSDQRYCGTEILIRWNNPELGNLSPAEFIPIAEADGSIGDITDFVLNKFLDDYPRIAAAWGAAPLPAPHAINLSPLDLFDISLPEKLTARLWERGLKPASLELEITEGIMMSSDLNVKNVLKKLKVAGYRLTIDDFGTGYSSLSYLYRMEADSLKIDQSFVRLLEPSGSMSPIVDAIISMGNALNISVVAEGVETEKQAKYLLNRGCTLAQGFWFSKPLELESYLSWLKDKS